MKRRIGTGATTALLATAEGRVKHGTADPS